MNVAGHTSVTVDIDERHGVEKSLRKFKRMCEAYGVVREYRKRQDYKKPSVQKKEKTEAAIKRKSKNALRVARVHRF